MSPQRQLETNRRVKQLVLTPEGGRTKRLVESMLGASPGLENLADADRVALGELLKRSLDPDQG